MRTRQGSSAIATIVRPPPLRVDCLPHLFCPCEHCIPGRFQVPKSGGTERPSGSQTRTFDKTVLGYPVVMTESFARQAEEIAKHQAQVIANEAEITKRWAEELVKQTTEPLAKPVVYVRGRYKYTVQLLNHPFNHGGQFGRLAVENLLNDMGQKGWEFVESMPHEGGRMFVFRSLGE